MQKCGIAIAAVIVLGVGLSGPPSVHAHAFLDHAEPRVGSTVHAAPAALTLTFTEPVEASFCHVEIRGAHDEKVVGGVLEHPKPEDLRLPLPPLAAGDYTVHWTVTSVDTHQTEGSFEFYGRRAVITVLAIATWFDLVGTIVFAGGYVFAAVGTPSREGRRVMLVAAAVLAAALAAELAINALRMAAISSSGGLAFAAEMIDMRWCRLWIARCAGLGLLLMLRQRAVSAALLAALWLALRSFQGHAGAHGTLPAMIDWVHLLAAASWIGSLVQLALLGSAALPAMAETVRRLATASVLALIPAGLYGAFLHVPSVDRLAGSPYGRTLLIKLALAAVLLILGGTNHFRSVPALLQDRNCAAEQRLRRIVGWELVIVALLIFATAWLTVLAMPHAAVQ